MGENKRDLVTSLEDLKVEFVEKRRKKYFEDLETFTESNISVDLLDESKPLGESEDVSEGYSRWDLQDVLKNQVNEILVFPEFVTCLDFLISEEVCQINKSLYFVRPEGSRCLIYIKNYMATVYNKEGYVKKTFQVNSKGPTVLDSVNYPSELVSSARGFKNRDEREMKFETYYLLDVLVLNGRTLATSELECRLFFLDSLIDELNSSPKVLFQFVKYKEVKVKELRTVYERIRRKEYEYETDSIIFVSKSATYVGGYNPNWLCYKDSNLNKYCVSDEVVCKVYKKNNLLQTCDNTVIGEVEEEYENDIIKISVESIENFKIKYKIVGEARGQKNPDSARKIYVNFINRSDCGDRNFSKLVCNLESNNM